VFDGDAIAGPGGTAISGGTETCGGDAAQPFGPADDGREDDGKDSGADDGNGEDDGNDNDDVDDDNAFGAERGVDGNNDLGADNGDDDDRDCVEDDERDSGEFCIFICTGDGTLPKRIAAGDGTDCAIAIAGDGAPPKAIGEDDGRDGSVVCVDGAFGERDSGVGGIVVCAGDGARLTVTEGDPFDCNDGVAAVFPVGEYAARVGVAADSTDGLGAKTGGWTMRGDGEIFADGAIFGDGTTITGDGTLTAWTGLGAADLTGVGAINGGGTGLRNGGGTGDFDGVAMTAAGTGEGTGHALTPAPQLCISASEIEQSGKTIELASIVTVVPANSRPVTVAPDPRVIDA